MNRIVTGAAALLAAGGAVGCHSTGAAGRDRPPADDVIAKYVDPCWPERYNYTARQLVLQPFATQVSNAHILDQTLLNLHFEPGGAAISGAGYEKLNYLARRRPAPDPRIFLQTSHDLTFDPAKADDFVKARRDLDAKRAEVVKAYLAAETAARPTQFEVTVIDPSEPTTPVRIVGGAAAALPGKFGASLSNVVGTSTSPNFAPQTNVQVNSGNIPGTTPAGGLPGGAR